VPPASAVVFVDRKERMTKATMNFDVTREMSGKSIA
jgi:hypothetical protein